MREIKLKAYYKNNRGEYTETKLFGDDITPINDVLREYQKSDYVISQWTGLKDKNGVEIYEGDIVQLTDVKSRIDMYKVVIKDGCTMFNSFDEDWIGRITDTDIKVIGNIYENQELLKSTQ